MKKLFIIFFTLISFMAYSQSGVGYLNYKIYNIISNTTGAYANTSNDFVNMFDVTKGTKLFSSGVNTAQNCLSFQNGFISTTPNGGSYTGIKFEGYFVPKETGAYSFGIDGDDAVDFSLDGIVVTSFYGAHGFGGYRYGNVSLVAGKSYKFMARYQNWGGGWGMRLVWKRPSQSTWSLQSNEVTTTDPPKPTKQAIANFKFNTNLDATKFLVNTSQLDVTGKVDITNDLDSIKMNDGFKPTISAGNTEWSYVNPNASWLGNGNSRLLIDIRQFGTVDPTTVKNVKILDAYDGPVTYLTHDVNGWAEYKVPSSLTKITDGTSMYRPNIRDVNNSHTDYAFTCTVSFMPTMVYKPQSVVVSTTNNLPTLYNSILTVSDVYLAFKELSNNGLFGNQTGNEFTYGIQYKNSDVNDDGVFNESDCFLLLQHLTGVKNIVDNFTLNSTIKLFSQTKYDLIGKSNWTTISNNIGNNYSFDVNTGKSIDTLNLAVAWKGDVNLSHSTTPNSNGLTTNSVKTMNSTLSTNEIFASLMGENIDNKLIVTITLDPLQQEVVGTQFQLNYENTALKFEKVEFTTKGNPINYGTDKGNFINIGSLISDGSTTLDKTTEYKITFLPLMLLSDTLGLTSVSTTDAVSKNGTQLKVKMN
jgi:PA14 domain